MFAGNWCTPEIYKVRKDYRPLRTIKLEMEYSRRSEIKLSAGVSTDINATETENIIDFEHFKYAVDGVTSFSTVPLRFATIIGCIVSALSFIYLIFV